MSTSSPEMAFNQLMCRSVNNIRGQFYTDKGDGLFIDRPSYWMDFQPDSPQTEAYTEALDTWANMMDEDAKLTMSGLAVAHRIADPEFETPSLETHLAERYNLADDDLAFAITSRAMWDLLIIRGIPTTRSPIQ
jgi:hypothetical protein